ncbi:MAG: hypothetical protein ACMXYC_03055 [Candidatus Woesearchaeota archaeon]
MSKHDNLYEITVAVQDSEQQWFTILQAESKEAFGKRASLHITHNNNITHIRATAQDAIALKTVLSAITKFALIIQDMQQV